MLKKMPTDGKISEFLVEISTVRKLNNVLNIEENPKNPMEIDKIPAFLEGIRNLRKVPETI